jgi:C4-dicarboxylate-specific signal transduction histidine kinase
MTTDADQFDDTPSPTDLQQFIYLANSLVELLETEKRELSSIPLESTRRERRYCETQMALAHANRVATMGQLTASIAHEV